MTSKTTLVDALAAAGLSKADSKKAVETVFETISKALIAGDKVQLVGFGTFSINERPERQGINPANKQPITIAAKKVVKFKAGSALDEQVNK